MSTEEPAPQPEPQQNQSPPKSETILRANVDRVLPHELAEVQQKREWSGPGFWGRWVGVTTLGWALGGVVLGALSGLTGSAESAPVRAANLVMALVILVLQWTVLRPRLPRAWRWIPVGFAGEAVGFALVLAVQLALRGMFGGPSITENIAGLFIPAIPLVVAQWLLLSTYARRAWRWLLANLIWLVLFLPLALLGVSEDFPPSMEEAIGRAIGLGIQNAVLGFIASAIVGAELVWLLRHPKQPPPEPPPPGEPAIH